MTFYVVTYQGQGPLPLLGPDPLPPGETNLQVIALVGTFANYSMVALSNSPLVNDPGNGNLQIASFPEDISFIPSGLATIARGHSSDLSEFGINSTSGQDPDGWTSHNGVIFDPGGTFTATTCVTIDATVSVNSFAAEDGTASFGKVNSMTQLRRFVENVDNVTWTTQPIDEHTTQDFEYGILTPVPANWVGWVFNLQATA